jgi:hypothetical protein
MKSRIAIILSLALLAVPPAAEAQQARKIPRIGLLSPGFSAVPSPLREALWMGSASLATSTDGRLSSNTGMRKGKMSDCPTWRPTWPNSSRM